MGLEPGTCLQDPLQAVPLDTILRGKRWESRTLNKKLLPKKHPVRENAAKKGTFQQLCKSSLRLQTCRTTAGCEKCWPKPKNDSEEKNRKYKSAEIFARIAEL